MGTTSHQTRQREAQETESFERPASQSAKLSVSESDNQRPFVEHLEELRRRIFRSLLWVVLGTGICWTFAPRILTWLLQPFGQVVFLSPMEPLLIHMKAAFLGGLGISFPLLAFEGWGFLSPALRLKERWLVLVLLPVSIALFLLGGWFGWQILLPLSLRVLLSFGSDVMTPMLTIGHAVDFAGWMVVGCGILAQLPLVLVGLTRAGIVTPRTLIRQWRWALLAILGLAAVLTPGPDLFSQILLAVPLGVLYGLSVVLSFLLRRKHGPDRSD